MNLVVAQPIVDLTTQSMDSEAASLHPSRVRDRLKMNWLIGEDGKPVCQWVRDNNEH